MFMPMVQGGISLDGGHIIEGSGLFSSNGVLTRTLSSSNTKKWTVETIVKKAKDGSQSTIFDGGTTNTNYTWVRFETAHNLRIRSVVGSSAVVDLITTQVFRDFGAYLHIVVTYDSANATASERVKLFINGTRVTDFSTETYPSLNQVSIINSAVGHRIGTNDDSSQDFDGYLSRVTFIDGQALDPTSFGEVTDDGFWQINDVSELTFGNNGFLLEGANVATGVATGGSLSQATSYTNTDGQGNRTSTITASSNVTPDSGTVNNWVDGGVAQTSSDSIEYTGAIAQGDFFRFQFSSNRFIDEITLINTGSENSLGNWKVQGSTDASTWDDLASFVYSNNGGQTISLSNVDAGGYSYYQLIENDTSQTYAGQWYAEIKFKIAETVGAVFTKTGTITATNDSPTNDADDGYGNYSTIDPLNTRTTTNTHVASQALTNGNRTTAITVADAHQAYTQTLSPGGKYHVEQTCGTWGSDANGGHAIMILCPKSKWEGSTTGPAVVTSAFAFHARTPGGLGFGPITRLSGSNLTTLGTEVANGNRVTYDIDMSTIGSTTVKISIEGSLKSTDSSMAFADEEYVMAFNVDNVARSIDFTMNTGSDAFVDTPVTGHVAVSTATQSTPDVINYEDEYYIEANISHSNGSTTAVTLPWNTSTYETMVTVKRTNTTGSWYRVDTLRGGTKAAQMEGNAADITNSDGGFSGTSFVITSDYASGTYLLEATKYGLVSATAANEEGSINTLKTTSNNDSKAFMLTWTGTTENGTLGHGLDVAPEFIVASDTDTGSACDRFVFHKDVPSAGRLFLDTNAAADTNANGWQNTAPSTTLVSVGTGSHNGTGTSVMWGYASSSVFDFGSYIGNSNADGPVVNVGGYPITSVIKRVNAASEYYHINGVSRNTNPNGELLLLENTQAQYAQNSAFYRDLLSNGFKILNADAAQNHSGSQHIYMAFGIQPMTDGSVNQGRAGAVPPYDQAYGGNTIKRVGNFWVHTFTSSGTFTPVSDGAVDYLVIGGGGGAGGYRGGGGGAGGYRSSWNSETSGGGGSSETALSLTASTTYTVTIGAGGAGGAHNSDAANGSNSVFSSITSLGGGGGGSAVGGSGSLSTGGSGGGATGDGTTKNPGAGTSGQGNNGGDGYAVDPNYAGGGGGGAGAVGQQGSNQSGGNGGAGVASTITGSSVIRGGGGGGGVLNGTSGSAGSGGGGAGAGASDGNAGTANTGGGGGSLAFSSSYASHTGGAGGSGIVIIRYAIG